LTGCGGLAIVRRAMWKKRVALVVLTAMLAPASVTQSPAQSPAAGSGAVPGPKAPAPAGEAEFDAGLAAVHSLMQKAKWADARTALLELVRAHEKKIYVQAQAEALAADLRTCAFHATAKVPKVGDVITGKIASFDERTSRIKVVYADHFVDWEGEEGELRVNPLVFAGNYTVTVSGSSYPSGRETLSVCFDLDPSGDGFFIADLGIAPQAVGRGVVSLDARILHVQGENRRGLAVDRSPAAAGEPFKAVLRVAEDRVELQIDNKPPLKAKRQKARFGHIGLWSLAGIQEVVLEGRIEPACVQGRIDTLLDEQRVAFEATYDPKKELPAWVFERPAVKRTPANADSWLPGRGRFSEAFAAMMQLLEEGKLAEASVALQKLRDDDAPKVSREFLTALLHLRMDRPEQTDAICARLLAEDATMGQARLLRARAWEELGRDAEAIAEFEALRAEDAGNEEVYEALCIALLRRGRADDARRIVREGKLRHGLWEQMAPIERMLAMAARGPNWPRRFSHQSTHYEVFSDIDRKVCIDACSLLETSYVNLMGQFAWIKEDKSQPRFRVFLFSGESGYQEYNKAILGEAVPHSAGLYSPLLKQLLIWNLPKREDMVRTIRHEGFHQFLDRVMANPPSWLNEGLAEFWETATRTEGRLLGGQVRGDHLATLARSRKALPKLKELVYGGSADFYANAQLRYAQGWALVHFLRKGPAPYPALFDKLWAELRATKGTRQALDAAFAGVDWDKFEQAFWAHVQGLR
jgi:hypothetical protein